MKFTRTLSTLSAVTLLFVLAGCSNEDDTTVDVKEEPLMPEKADEKPQQAFVPKTAEQKRLSASGEASEVTLTGTIVYKEMEGGFYAFIAENGDRYTLQKLDKKFHRNGLIVKITGMPMPDLMTITQYGTVLKVDSVEILDASRVIGNASSH